jgi:endonuclease/exonuclease/phosphatase family metal-dependent hydrolase
MDPSESPRLDPLRFLTFNIRLDTVVDAATGDRWPDRVKAVLETVTRLEPDVVGFQEALQGQLDDLAAGLPGYLGIGKPREVGETGEYVPVFVNTRRVDIVDRGDFWLSPTPDSEGSRGWDTDVPRHCTWAKLIDRLTEATFAVFNTHLDWKGSLARFEAAKLIVGRAVFVSGVPTVVMGDFNAEEDSDTLTIFREAGFRDTFRELHPHAVDVQTVHHYTDLEGPRKIDYIMCSPRWQVRRAEIVRDHAAGRLPSDHFPVLADLLPDPEVSGR